MLAQVRGAQTIRARIQDLRMNQRFDAVVLASHLINTDEVTRRAFLRTCRWHLAERGCVIIEQYPPGWFASAAPAQGTIGGVTYRLGDLSRPASGVLAATVDYIVGDRAWTHSFTSVEVPEEGLGEVLGESGLSLDTYLSQDRSWFRAVPTPDQAC